MNEFDEGVIIPTDIPPPRQEILAALEEKDYPRDTNFADLMGLGLLDLIRQLGSLLFGIDRGGADTMTDDLPTEAIEKLETMERQAAEALAEVFDRETLEKWPAMDMRERHALIEEYYTRLADIMGLDTVDIVVKDLNPEGFDPNNCYMGYFSEYENIIALEYRLLENPDYLYSLLDTLIHETRHQFQCDVVSNPEKFPDLPQSYIDAMTENWNNYLPPDIYGYELYANQPVEIDSVTFSEEILSEYIRILNGN